ncbi:MAG: alpha/beta hydrolase [Bacteroidota bacterium]
MTQAQLLHFETHQQTHHQQWILFVHGAGGSTRTWKRQIEKLGEGYNLLIVDLPGHGKNAGYSYPVDHYSFSFIAEKVWEVVDHLQIDKVHLVGISLGTIICLQMRLLRPQRVSSVVMPGAIVRLNTKLKILANISLGLARIIGFATFYKMSAYIMMPRRNHKKSREVFIREAKVLTEEEYQKWTAMYYNLNQTLKQLFQASSEIPHLLVMGEQDHLFLRPAQAFVKRHTNAIISVIPKCGHVVTIEKAATFNEICLQFLAKTRIS